MQAGRDLAGIVCYRLVLILRVLLLQVYTATVLLPTYSDVVVVQLNASDADTAEFTRLRYSVDAGNTGNRFHLNEESGVLTLREGSTEDGDMLDHYRLEVSVSDGKFVDHVVVNIEVKVLESLGLQFSMSEFDVEVLENTTTVEHVALLPLVGRSLNEHVSFALLNAVDHFSVHVTSGVVRTTGVPFDRERRDSYVVVVEARAERTPPRVAHTLLRVRVVDMNDNAPIFVHQPYFAMVTIDAAAGTVVKKVKTCLCEAVASLCYRIIYRLDSDAKVNYLFSLH